MRAKARDHVIIVIFQDGIKMCGICGIIGPMAFNPASRSVVQQMMAALAHRGPDDQGLVSGDNFIFGHRRLSVIDPEYGAQPMQSEDGEMTLVYNGEIYNYMELRQELSQQGVKFRTFSDTEVLLKLYQRLGPKCIDRLNGMFAFAIYDGRNKRFFAARDHFGIKPFYYSLLPDNSLVFASEIKGLFHCPHIQPALDREALNQYLTFQFCLGDKTLFQNVQKLEPANYLIWTEDGANIKNTRYWNLDYSIDTHHTEEYFVDSLLLLLQDSIKGQLRSDVPLGVYLSGGLDSSTVTTLASSQYGSGLKSFTGKFLEAPVYDESRFARIVADESNCMYHEIVPTAQDFVELLPKLIYHMDEPAAGPGLFPQYLVSKLANKHVTVVLGGQGGDEIFGGYARYQVAYLEQCLKGSIFETQEEGSHIVTLESIIPNLPLLKQYVPMLKQFWQQGVFHPMDRRYFRLVDRSHDLQQALHPDLWENYDSEEIFEQFQSIFNHTATKSYFNKMTHFDQQTLLPALLQVEDRMSMAVSLESRVPLLDYRIAELVASMPPTLKFKGGNTKYVLKKAMSSLLPKAILERKDKMGFPVPLMEWWNGPAKGFVSDILLSKSCKDRGIFEPKVLEELTRKESRYGRSLWGALCLELWHREFIDGNTIR